MRFHKVVKRLNAHTPGAGDVLRDRVTGRHFDLTGPARDFANGKSLAEEFDDTSLAKPAAAMTRAGQAPPKAVRVGWGHYTHAVLGAVNGAIEQTARKAMAGQAIKNSPLMEKHIVGLSDKALEDAAKGLRGTHNQVALGRAVDRMYGQYQKFSPEKRSLLLHWTPFLPWYLNTATFLTKVLPVDHPVRRRCSRTSARRRRSGARATTSRCSRRTTSPTSCSAQRRTGRAGTSGSRTTRRSVSAPTSRGRCRA
jgi:hypothetical protein